MKKTLTTFFLLVVSLVFVNAQIIKKPIITETKKEEVKLKPTLQKKGIPKIQEIKSSNSTVKSSKPNRDFEKERVEEEQKLERKRLAEIEKQKLLEAERMKAEKNRKNKEIYDKHLKWSKNMIETNGMNSCKSDSDCRKMVIERLQLALTYYNGEEAKNYLKQLQ